MERTASVQDDPRMAALLAAEAKAKALFDAIEAAGIVAPGRTETMVRTDIYTLAENDANGSVTPNTASNAGAATRP